MVGKEERFLYFRQKGPGKICYIKPGYSGDDLSALFSGSMENLDDSRVLMDYWKKRGINEVGISVEEMQRRRGAQEADAAGKK